MFECCKGTVAGRGLLTQAVFMGPVVNIGRSDLDITRYYSKIFTFLLTLLFTETYNPFLHRWIRYSCSPCGDGSSTIQISPLLFNIGMVI